MAVRERIRNIKHLRKRALEVRKKYSNLELKKHGKAWTNSQLMEGSVGDVGDLMKLVMAKEGVREIEQVDDKLAHELSDCLWCILVLADRYGIDLEKAFMKTMDELEERIKKA